MVQSLLLPLWRLFQLELPGYEFQALRTNLPVSVSPVEVWRRYNGGADIENRIKELGARFGVKGLCCRSFWATAAACHPAICAYNLCIGLQRRLFTCAAVFSQTCGQPTFTLAFKGNQSRAWWRSLLTRIADPTVCDAVAPSMLALRNLLSFSLQLHESG